MMQPVIVIVDSDDAVLQLMEELLDSEGYATHAFCSYDVSIDAIQQAQPDLLIIEAAHTQPGITLNLINQLRLHTYTNRTPIIVNSTSPQLLHTLSEPLQYLGCLLLEKPFDVDQFLQCISDAMKSHELQPSGNPCVTST